MADALRQMSAGRTKQQIASLLCARGIEAGYDVVPEYMVMDGDTKQMIDIVWVRKASPENSRSSWSPVAAFEIEGHCVKLESMDKNVASYRKLCAQVGKEPFTEGAPFFRVVLFSMAPFITRQSSQPCYWNRVRMPDMDKQATRAAKRFMQKANADVEQENPLDDDAARMFIVEDAKLDATLTELALKLR
jgi:hypothetical protein